MTLSGDECRTSPELGKRTLSKIALIGGEMTLVEKRRILTRKPQPF